MNIPHWLKAYLSAEQGEQIAGAIQRAESTTSGEIVPMIVRRSSTVGHVPMILLALSAALFFALDGPGWRAEVAGEHWAWYVVEIVILVAASALLSRFHWVQRLLTTRADQVVQVNMRAEIEFYESGIKETRDSTGVLIFVSLMEQRAVVLADKAINDKVPQETWQEVRDLLIQGMKQKNVGLAFGAAILKCGEILTPSFPIRPDDENELQNQLIIKEGLA
jgi:putative membrane protein